MSVKEESLQEHYGFRENPYDSAALGVNRDDEQLFVGRDQEAQTLSNILLSLDHGAVVVEGGFGVGKTSFVNVQAYRLRKKGILPSLHNIELRDIGPTEFLLSVLSNNLNALRKQSPNAEKSQEFLRLLRAVEQTLLSARSFDVSASALGTGAGVGIGKSLTATSPSLALLPTASKYLDDFAVLAQESGYKRIVVSVNNLANVPTEVLIRFLNTMRDLTIVRRNYFWVFLGPVGSRNLIATKAPSVSELISLEPILLAPLSKDEVHEAIEARVDKYRVHPKTEPPIARGVVDLLYDSGKGEFRFVMNRCTGLLLQTMREFPTASKIPLELAVPMLREVAISTVDRANLTPKQREVLAKLAQKGSAQPKDSEAFGFQNVPAFLRYLQIFYELKLVDRRERGREVVYVPRGDVALAFGQPVGRPA